MKNFRLFIFSLILLCTCVSQKVLAVKGASLSETSREILKAKCADCHSSKAVLPPYANVPFFKDLIKKDIEDGLADLDLERDLENIKDKDLDDGVLIHMETVLADNTMPPIQYGIIHWDKYLTKKEKETLTQWINSVYKLKGL